MDDGGPHYSNEALVAKYQLMAASRNALPHLLAERELLVAVAEAARYAVPVSCCDTDICDTSRADTDGCQGSVSGKCARVEALQALARLDSEETP
jgi:hypothetical protein